VPVRAFVAATASRRRVERLAKREGAKIPGGLWLTEDPARQREMLERQFARLFETLARYDIPVTLLWFPRLIEDPEYLFRQLGWLFGQTKWVHFERAFRDTVRPEWVHEFPEAPAKMGGPPAASPVVKFHGTPEEEATGGEAPYLEVLARIHRQLAPSLYLEIGVRHGRSLALARAKAVGIDPEPELQVDLAPGTAVIARTSDAFFSDAPARALGGAPDLVFIDGMHHFEFALRDFMHAERLMPPHGLIVIDDVFPNHPAQAERERRTGSWTGDVWKLRQILEAYRPDLYLLALDTAPTGLLLIARLDMTNSVLQENYPAILARYSAAATLPAEVLARRGAVSPNGPEFARLLHALKQAREERLSPNEIAARLGVDASPPSR